MTEFTPILYLKSSCPFCLKVAAFLAEAGVFDRFEVREFWPDDEREAAIRDELSPHFKNVSFPALQYAPGEFMNESDAIIDRYAAKLGIDPEGLPFYRYILTGPLRGMREQFAQIRQLNEKLAERM